MLELIGVIGGIVLIDLALSGDNALVIGAAAASLPARQRLRAILLGGAGAILFRIIFALAATLLLRLPLVQAVGGVVLLYIAARLLADRHGKHSNQSKHGEYGEHRNHGEQPLAAPSTSGLAPAPAPSRGFAAALLTILVADVTMSLDNVLAIGALAHGNLPVLAIGLLLSIALVLAGSALVAGLIQRLPWLLDIAALVLGWTAAGMVLHDLRLGPVLHDLLPYAELLLYTAGIGIVLVADLLLRVRSRESSGGVNVSGH